MYCAKPCLDPRIIQERRAILHPCQCLSFQGACVIQFSHPIEAVQAVAMLNGQRLYDRPLMVKMDKFEKVCEKRRMGRKE